MNAPGTTQQQANRPTGQQANRPYGRLPYPTNHAAEPKRQANRPTGHNRGGPLRFGSTTPFEATGQPSIPYGDREPPWVVASPDQPDTTLTSLTLTAPRRANEKREQGSTPGQKRQTNQPDDPVGTHIHFQPNRAGARP